MFESEFGLERSNEKPAWSSAIPKLPRSQPDRGPASSRSRAFTLVELLAVIATLGLVSCLLAPALSRTHSSSQAYQCVNRLRQLMTAVMMYAPDYHDLLPPNPDDGNATPGYSWCAGGAGIKEVDEFNPDLLKDPHRTLVAPYLNYSAEIFRCPADRRTGEYDGAALYPASPLIGAKVPAARSVSMNNAIGTIDPCFSSGAGHCGVPNLPVNGPWLTGVHGGNSASKGPWRTYGKTTQMTAPSPAGLWVFIEEDQFSINDPVFAMSAGSPVWIDYPASRHEGAAVVAFADAHAEIHRWVDRTTILNGPASQRSVSTNSADWSWLSTRTSSKLQQP